MGKAIPKKKKQQLRFLIAIPLVGVAMWLAVHHVPGFGPWVADSLRAVFGNAFVARLEDTVYAAEDWVNRTIRRKQPPKAFWSVPSGELASGEAATGAAPSGESPTKQTATTAPTVATSNEAAPFSRPPLSPMYKNIATRGDGVWLPLSDPRHPGQPTQILKTFVHPDKNRSWSIVAILAIDLSRVELHSVAGRFEPKSKTAAGKDYQRTAVVPVAHHQALIGAFNGGYKATHGDYGMMIDGVTLVIPRPFSCVIAKYKNGKLAIRSWETLSDGIASMQWYRQTPVCMYDDGKAHPGLSMPKLGWGASAVSGTTVIRRSAIGIDHAGKVLFVGIGDFCTGKSIAEAMRHAGAHSVAQLDVNFSFPKFVTYKSDKTAKHGLRAVPLTDHFEFTEDQYIGTRSHRDFFYLTRRKDGGASPQKRAD